MADDLFGPATELLRTASQGAQADADRTKTSTDQLTRSGDAASTQLGEDRRQKSGQIQEKDMAMLQSKLDQQKNEMMITPQIALGLVKNTGDKEWMKAVGTKMRSDVVLGMFSHGMDLAYAKKQPKITQIYDASGKIRHAVVYTDENGNQQELMLDAGITPAKLNEGKGGRGRGGAGGDDDLKKQKAFMSAHEKQAALLNDASKSEQLKATNPEQYNRMKEQYEKDQDRYDQLVTQLGSAGAAKPDASAGGSSAAPGDTPFDADALIKEALGGGK